MTVVDRWLASLVPAGVTLTPSEQELMRRVVRGRHEDQIAALFELYGHGLLSRSLATTLVPRLWRFRPDGCPPAAADWLALFRRADYTHDFQVRRKPRRSVRLFRGATEENRHGISWTKKPELAEYFARFRQAPGRVGQVWQARVEPFRLLTLISDEVEYVIDPLDLDITPAASAARRRPLGVALFGWAARSGAHPG